MPNKSSSNKFSFGLYGGEKCPPLCMYVCDNYPELDYYPENSWYVDFIHPDDFLYGEGLPQPSWRKCELCFDLSGVFNYTSWDKYSLAIVQKIHPETEWVNKFKKDLTINGEKIVGNSV